MSQQEFDFRKLTKYKYQLNSAYQIQSEISPIQDIPSDFVDLDSSGMLTIKKHYAWDGASGPARDTKTILRASLVHDALYQLLSLELLDRKFKDDIDRLFQKICREDGMTRFRAWYVYKAVCWFGKGRLKSA